MMLGGKDKLDCIKTHQKSVCEAILCKQIGGGTAGLNV